MLSTEEGMSKFTILPPTAHQMPTSRTLICEVPVLLREFLGIRNFWINQFPEVGILCSHNLWLHLSPDKAFRVQVWFISFSQSHACTFTISTTDKCYVYCHKNYWSNQNTRFFGRGSTMNFRTQECILVGCLPTAAVAISGRRIWQMPVKTLPSSLRYAVSKNAWRLCVSIILWSIG